MLRPGAAGDERVDTMFSFFLFFFFVNILLQHKAHFPKRFLAEAVNLRVGLCPGGTHSHLGNFGFVPGSVVCSYVRFMGGRKSWRRHHSARAPMGSHAGRTMGSCSNTASTSSGTYFLSTTTS